ncbi:Uncharacterised protein [BD1-7 clade bacterium]|uniref:DUF2165 domain-containing protein n=1 Tax=BD1-7 clade bacterium TaxID=2029982 RepID=A0A5S9QT90_9GAMM|nr:Uncharacterised protein [BD1-7 clade bacterium]
MHRATSMRVMKALLVLAFGLFAFLVCINNLFYPSVNLQLASQVLMMDAVAETLPTWRALPQQAVTFAFGVIVFSQAVISLLCTIAGVQLLRYRRSDASLYDRWVSCAGWGLVLAVMLWFVGFIAIGGEWFMSWTLSASGRGSISSAFRFSSIALFILIFIYMPEPQSNES